MSLFRAELVKLRGWGRLGVWVFVAFAVLAGFSQYNQLANHRTAEERVVGRLKAFSNQPPLSPEQIGLDQVGGHSTEWFLERQRDGIAAMRALDSVPGALATTGGLLAQGLGVGLALLVSAFILGSEFQERTITTAVVHAGSRARVFAAKLAAIVVVLAGAGLAIFLGQAAANLLFAGRVGPHVIPAAPMSDLAAPIAEVVAAAAVVQFLVATLSVAFTTLRRSVAGGLATAAGVLVVDLVFSQLVKPYTRWSIAYNVQRAAFDTPKRASGDFVRTWVRNFPIEHRIALWSTAVEFLAVAAVLVVFAYRTLRKAELA